MAKTNTKIIGKEHYINASTGELMEMDVIESIEKDVDSNFYKLFMKDFLYAMDIVSNQKSKVAYWIIDHLQKDNMFVYSYRQVAEMTGISYQTVAATIKALKDADFLRQEGKSLKAQPRDAPMYYTGMHKLNLETNSLIGSNESATYRKPSKIYRNSSSNCRWKNLKNDHQKAQQLFQKLQKSRRSISKLKVKEITWKQ